MKFLIRVGQIHIDRGEIADCESCPVALAMLEQIPGVEHVQVSGGGSGIVALYGSNATFIGEYKLPKVARQFADDFDDEIKVKPFAFEFSMDDEESMPGVYNFCRQCERTTGTTAEMRCAGCRELICLVCGCTESRACVDETTEVPCGWARPGICTSCIGSVDSFGNPNGAQVAQMVIENQANSRTNH